MQINIYEAKTKLSALLDRVAAGDVRNERRACLILSVRPWIASKAFLLDADDALLYVWRDPGLLGFSATMHRPLAFLDPFLGDAAPAA